MSDSEFFSRVFIGLFVFIVLPLPFSFTLFSFWSFFKTGYSPKKLCQSVLWVTAFISSWLLCAYFLHDYLIVLYSAWGLSSVFLLIGCISKSEKLKSTLSSLVILAVILLGYYKCLEIPFNFAKSRSFAEEALASSAPVILISFALLAGCFFRFCKDCENEGYKRGEKVGYKEGSTTGIEDEKAKSYEEGYKQGKDEGYSEGHDEGYEEGYEDGRQDTLDEMQE